MHFYLRACFEIDFDQMPRGGPRFVVAAVMRQTGATPVPLFFRHALTGRVR